MYAKEDPKSIQNMFDSIAKKYDLANSMLSFSMHRLWNRQLIQKTLTRSDSKISCVDSDILDLCCGTGDISLHFLKNNKNSHKGSVYLLDFSSEMLACARQKAHSFGLDNRTDPITYLEADATVIPLSAESIDRVTVAYGIRNVKDRERCFSEVRRILRPGGILGILELTRPKNPLLHFAHHFYLKTALPILGKLITSNQEAYRYLCNSIHNFAAPEELVRQLQEQGFKDITCSALMGGIATLITAKK